MKILTSIGDTLVHATQQQIDAIEVLQQTRKGGCASVKGYKPKTNWKKDCQPTQNIQFLSRVSTANLYARKIAALEAVSFADIKANAAKDPVLAKLSDTDLMSTFHIRLDFEITGMAGKRSNAHTAAHERNYIKISEGIKVNLDTAATKDENGDVRQLPVLTNGHPTVKVIMVSALFLNVTTTVEGVRHYPNSKAPVRMSNIIKGIINKSTLQLKMLSLNPDNFDSLTIDKNVILPSDIAEFAA